MSVRIKILTWNVENLFILPEFVDASSESGLLFPADLDNWLKPTAKIKELAATINRYDPDIVFLQEVGGNHAFEVFARKYLEERYSVAHLMGNSERGIEVGYLIKKESHLNFELISHAKHRLDLSHIKHPNINYHHFFERNVLELKLKEGPFSLSLFGVHLKSGFDPTGKDPGGRLKRKAEVQGLVEIVEHRMQEEGGEYILLGDFNATAAPENYSEEFAPLFKLTGIHELLSTLKVPRSERATFLHTTQREIQLDYIFFSPGCLNFIDRQTSGLVYPRDIGGGPFRWPTSTAFKQGLPSDHLPLLIELCLP